MGGLGGSIDSPKLADIQIQTSVYGKPIPIVFGTQRVPGNLIWYDDFQAHQHSESAGKGGAPAQVNYTYTASVVIAICEGPIVSIGKVWADKERGQLSKYGFTLIRGNREQGPWGWLAVNHPSKALGYSGTVLVCSPNVDLGTDGTMKNYGFEVRGFASIPDGDPGSPDANPADVMEILTNPFYGARWDAGLIGDLTLFRRYCTAAGFWISPAFIDQKTVGEHAADILMAANSEAVWSDGVLKIVPRGDIPIVANGVDYEPDLTPQYDLGYDDFVSSEDHEDEEPRDPITVQRTSPADTWNDIPVRIRARLRHYNEKVYSDPDNADISETGLRRKDPIDLACITRKEHARAVSRLEENKSLYIRNTYKFSLSWRHFRLEPMDFVTVTDEKLGVDHMLIRITTIEENEKGRLSVEAIEWPVGVGHALGYDTEDNDPEDPDNQPGPADEPVIFEPPAIYSNGRPLVALAASGQGEKWGGCEIWISEDGDSYTRIGRITGPSKYGELTAALAAIDGLDNTNTLSVDLSISKGTMQSQSADARDALVTLCWVGGGIDGYGEMLSFKNAVLTGPSAYNLTSLQRGVYGDPPKTHDIGDPFVRINDDLFLYQAPDDWVGRTIYVKLRSFNLTGNQLEDLADVTAYPYTIVGRQFPLPYNVTATLSAAAPWRVTVNWAFRQSRPHRLLAGFKIELLPNGADPDDAGNALAPPVISGRDDRFRVLHPPPLDVDTDAFVAVRVEFNDGP